MGLNIEIYINVDLRQDTPASVIETLKAMCGMENKAWIPIGWDYIFRNHGYETPVTECRNLTYDVEFERWSLLAKGDTKDWKGVEKFFEWIALYVDGYPGDFIGYYRYESDQAPDLVFLPEGMGSINNQKYIAASPVLKMLRVEPHCRLDHPLRYRAWEGADNGQQVFWGNMKMVLLEDDLYYSLGFLPAIASTPYIPLSESITIGETIYDAKCVLSIESIPIDKVELVAKYCIIS